VSSPCRLLAALQSQLEHCLLQDAHALERRLRGLERRHRAGQPIDRGLPRLQRAVAEAEQRAVRRLEAAEPLARAEALNYPQALPVVAARARILEALAEHQVVVVAGETGSGKTTQLPKLCLELGRGRRGLIGHTQPRRLAARTVAARIAAELGTELGEVVGYQVRFGEQLTEHSLVKLMTDGILLAEIQHDPLLLRYDTLIIDEAHERSLNIDFLLGYLHRLLPRRPDLRLIITSATIDVERFSEHFGDAPVIEVSGRSHPVELRYQPLETLSEEGDFGEACRLVMEQIIQEDGGRGGDVLVFLPGEREIRDVARSLRRAQWAGVEVLPLYARLSLAEQNRVFDVGRRRGRRIVLATNVAETSLTVPGIHYVIDVGLARVSRYSVRSRLQRLPVEPISQASADQRAGRCGRIAPGICYRLYSEEDYDSRPEFTDPEIRRTNLAAVILQMLSLGLGDIEAFPFMEPPDPRQISDGFRLLEELGAVDERRQLTDQGRILGRLPVDPRIGRMLVEARSRGALREVLIIASALSCQDPREWPADQRQAAAEQHRRFLHPESDFLAWTALWEHVEEQRQQLTAAPFRRLCQREFLSWLRLREWREVHRQLRLLCRDLDREERGGRWQENSEPADYESIHRSLLSGLLSQIAHRHEGREYQATRNRRVRLFPGSALHAKPPQWLMAAEVVETRQVYARTCARIEPEWVLGINDALLRRSWGEPYWQRRSGRVMARETVMLYGLVLSDGKPVHYGPIDPAGSREVFIQQALVEDQLSGEAEFQRRNRALVAELEELEDKGRRRDILADQQVLYSFFDERIPADITSARQFHQWRRRAEKEQPQLLVVPRSRLMRHGASEVSEAQFPDRWQWRDLSLPLEYRFEPGHEEDGVTLVVPIALLNRIPAHRLDYLVPGLLRDKCIALARTLPRALRRQLVPVPDAVDAALEFLQVSNQPLTEALSQALSRARGVELPLDAWRPEELEPFYRMHLRVLDEAGQVAARGRDLDTLTGRLQQAMQQALQRQARRDETGALPVADSANGAAADEGLQVIEGWEFGELPESVALEQAGAQARAYPALEVQGEEVVLTLMASAERARAASMAGLVLLWRRACADTVKYLRKQLLRGNELQLQLAGMGQQREDWLEQLLEVTWRRVFLGLDGEGDEEVELPRQQADFQRRLEAGRGRLVGEAQRLEQLLREIGQGWAELRRCQGRTSELAWLDVLNEVQQQLDRLLRPDFIIDTPLVWLERYPVYLAAMAQRLEKLRGHYQRDRELSRQLHPLQQRLDDWCARGEERSQLPAVIRYRWLLEELRVSLFAQQLGTRVPVSPRRLDQCWAEVEAQWRQR